MKVYKVPTGEIYIMEGKKGKLEFLSLGDYGKDANVKASFLGIDRDIEGVPHGEVLPLSEKWVVTISTQYGCSMNCKFCDVPMVGAGINATYEDLKNQVEGALLAHKEVLATKRLNVHYARMGEPTFNQNVFDFTHDLRQIARPHIGRSMVHPVVSTMMPKNNKMLITRLQEWCNDIKNDEFRGDAGLQLSINSTCDEQRSDMFSDNALTLNEISAIGKCLPEPKGRKYALNFALADSYEINPERLRDIFSPSKFMVKITPMHNTRTCKDSKISTTGGYEYFTPYKSTEEKLKKNGFDVLVFIPSIEEDESKITCGNAILSEGVTDGL